jgi:lipid II:glycine glycyltransferase (peptidoglycan interpeptide bridge formation enzyme)
MIAIKAVPFAEQEYQLRLSQAVEAKAWDDFLAATPGGHHVQTGLWAKVKETMNWQSVRLAVLQGDTIIAGAQILFRSLPLVGKIGFVAKGPLFSVNDRELQALVITELQKLARKHRIQPLVIQPGKMDEGLIHLLQKKGFRPSTLEVAPRATLLLDLSPDIETIQAGISSKTRYNIRLSGRKGIKVREGTEADLDTYYQILATTSKRKKFSPYPKAYFKAIWQVLRPYGYAQMFIAEYKGEVVSAQLAIPFGDTVINKMSVWNGRHGNRRPNEALQWAAITWAKAKGYRFYDFEGIKMAAARAVLNQEPIPDSVQQTVTSFKLGFGGQPVLFPAAYDYFYNPLLRWGHAQLFSRVRNNRSVKRLLKRIRTG